MQDMTEHTTTPSTSSTSSTSSAHTLEEAFGKGRGKHAGTKRRKHSNKYKTNSKATSSLDPWEAQLRAAEESKDISNALERAEMEEMEEGRRRRRAERAERGEELVYPDEEDIDPYDPSTFGYIEVISTA